MTVQRWKYGRLPPRPVRDEVVPWLVFHGLDPMVVCVPGWIERDDAARVVRALCYVRDGEDGRIVWDADAREPVRVVVEQRSEGPPLPFPPLVRRDRMWVS